MIHPAASMTPAKGKPAYLSLEPGGPWTFIYDKPIEGNPQPGSIISRWFATNESGRLFKIKAVHAPGTYETEYVGFQNLTVGARVTQ